VPVTTTVGEATRSVRVQRAGQRTTTRRERASVASNRFDRFLPLAGVLAGVMLLTGLIVLRDDPSSETGPAQTFSYWQADHGKHQIIGLIVAPLIAFLLVFFGAGLKRRLEHGGGDSGHGTVAFGGALLAAGTFALVGMLEAAMTNAAHEGQRQAVYALNQLHSYDWLGWNASFAAVLIATGLGARRNAMLPTPVAWVTIVVGASLLTPAGFFGFILLPLWLIAVGLLLSRGTRTAPERQPAMGAAGAPSGT
jgi:hypothetical protein